jgi:diketogulonate reductase-like aldo/keto reductase
MAEAQFQVLGVDTLDMIMLDYPSSSPGCDGVLGQWKAFEELYDAKRVRTVAVSNFNPAQLKCLSGHRVPAVNQMPFSVGHGKDTVVSDDAKFNIVVQAYSPLGSGGLAHDDLCISIGKKYGKSSVQVALKWILQSKVTIATQSTSFDHLKSDVDLFDFALSDAEMSQLNAYSPRSFIYT